MMKYVEVETMTQSNVPNINNVVYSSETINKMIDEYRSMNGRIVMAKIINDVKPSNNRTNTQFMQELRRIAICM